jgi:acid phosphatase
MDVDQTIFNNTPYVVRLIWGQRWHDQSAEEDWDSWCRQEAATAIPGAVEFITAVRALDEHLADVQLRLFLITNRNVSLEEATIANLRKMGVEIDPEFVLCLEEREGWDRNKASRRAHVADLGYRIAMIVGDDLNDLRPVRGLKMQQRLDLVQRHQGLLDRGLWVLVPNPIYGSWMVATAADADPGRPLFERLTEGLDPNLPAPSPAAQ